MIIDDFKLFNYINNNINIYILLEYSLRSLESLNMIKCVKLKSTFFLSFFDFTNNSEKEKYKNSILVVFLYENHINLILKSTKLFKYFIIKENTIIFILNNFDKRNSLYELDKIIMYEFIIIRFNDLNKETFLTWINEFNLIKRYNANIYKLYYFFLFFEKNINFVIFYLNMYSKYFKKLVFFNIHNLLLFSNNDRYAEKVLFKNIFYRKNNFIIFIYKNVFSAKKYIPLFKNFSTFTGNCINFNKKINFYKLLLDLNIKANNINIFWLIIFNFIIDTIFIKKK